MEFDQFLIALINGLSSGLLLFMLSSGLTLILGMLGVLNFAHAGFYMLGAYLACALAAAVGFTAALVLAPLAVGLLGALFERFALRYLHQRGHVPELLMTFGLSYVIAEAVQLVWGRAPLAFEAPGWLQGAAFTLVQSAAQGLSVQLGAAQAEICAAAGVACARFPMTRAFMALVALAMLAALGLLVMRSRAGLVIRAALTHPEMAQALGHDVPRVFTWVFGGGCALAALAGVIGGVTFVTEPSMAAALGPIVFVVVVVGGMGSLAGAFMASILIGLLQTLPLAAEVSVADLARRWGVEAAADVAGGALWHVTLAQAAPVLPYVLMVLVLVFRPQGLMGLKGLGGVTDAREG